MGNFNLKSIWKQNGGTGGSTNLEQRVQAIETNYLSKNANVLQVVRGGVDFAEQVVLKYKGYIDNVDTNAPTSMINKQYLEQQLTTTKNQIRSENNTFTGTNNFNNGVSINSAGNDFQWSTTRTWNQNVDNTVVRTADLKYYKAFETLSTVNINTTWSTGTQWTVNGVNTVGVHEFLICVAISNVLYTLNGKVVWKNDLTESKSQFITISDGGAEYMFQIVIKPNNTVALYHKKTGGSNNAQWVRGYIIRGNGLPWKMNQVW